MKAAFAALLLAATSALAQEVPSGQPITLQEVLIDEVSGETWLRFRFIAPHIARASGLVTYEKAAADIEHLCTYLAVPYTKEYDLEGDVVVISLADRETEFGVPDPEATQYFEAFRPVDNACILEGI